MLRAIMKRVNQHNGGRTERYFTIDFENQEIQNELNSGGSNDNGDFEFCELVGMEIINKEQGNQEAITLLKEWKERDGSEIEENYNKLIKEQENGE